MQADIAPLPALNSVCLNWLCACGGLSASQI